MASILAIMTILLVVVGGLALLIIAGLLLLSLPMPKKVYRWFSSKNYEDGM